MNTRHEQPVEAPSEHQQIVRRLACYEFPFDFTRSLEFALFRTFCVPSVSRLLNATQEFVQRARKRNDDTDLLVSEILENGYASERGRAAIARINVIHGRFRISNDDFLYVLSSFIYEPIRWIGRFGWRPLNERECLALFYFWRAVSACTSIPSRANTTSSNGSTPSTSGEISATRKPTAAWAPPRGRCSPAAPLWRCARSSTEQSTRCSMTRSSRLLVSSSRRASCAASLPRRSDCAAGLQGGCRTEGGHAFAQRSLAPGYPMGYEIARLGPSWAQPRQRHDAASGSGVGEQRAGQGLPAASGSELMSGYQPTPCAAIWRRDGSLPPKAGGLRISLQEDLRSDRETRCGVGQICRGQRAKGPERPWRVALRC